MARSLTTQDVSWFLDLNEKGQLDLDPPYQRRSVWSPRDRRYFIDTILNNYPAPPVFLHKSLDDNGKPTYHVVDGKQRLQTIISFTKDKVRIPEDFGETVLQGKKWSQLGRDTRERFWNYVIIAEMLPDTTDATLRSTFERINRNSKKLSPQEMRHAKYDGWFANTAENEAEKPEWRLFGISTNARSKRMQDVQFVSELMLLHIERGAVGFDQNTLDDVYADYDDLADLPDFDDSALISEFEVIKQYVANCLETTPSLKDFIKTQTHLYALWAFLMMRSVTREPVTIFAPKYAEFMKHVTEFASIGVHGPESSDDEAYLRQVEQYVANARGASTDRAQRIARIAALQTVL